MKKSISLLFLIVLIIALPVIYGAGNLYIGGDTIIPFGAENLQLYFPQWIDRQNGEYFFHNFYFYYILFAIFDYFTANIYLKGALLLLVIRTIAAVGLFKLIGLLGGKGFGFGAVLAAAFYLLSPAYYNGHVYWLVYAFIPWLFYAIVKIVKSGSLSYSDILLVNFVLFGISADLPNPKYLFHACLIIGVSLCVAPFFGKIGRKFYSENKRKLLLVVALSSCLFIPLAMFALNYDPVDYGGVTVKSGYVNDADAKMMDFRSSTADRMVRLFHDGMTLEPALRKEYLSNPMVIIANISFILLIVFYLLFKGKDKDIYDYLFLLLLIIYLFFAIGPNPPFGALYEYLVTSSPVFAFLRTTAGAVFYLSLLYSVLIYFALKHFKKTWAYILFLTAISVTAYPMLNGSYYRNWSNLNNYIDTNSYGLKVPSEYFELKGFIESKRLDAKVYMPQSNLGYINTKWGYFGPAGFYNMMYRANFIGNDKIYSPDIGVHNVGYVFTDYTLIGGTEMGEANSEGLHLVAKNNIGAFYGLKEGTFLPRVYTSKTASAKGSFGTESSSISWVPGMLLPERFQGNSLIVEYKKISPTKYRVLLHGVSDDFILVLTEQFHKLWDVYIVDMHHVRQPKLSISDVGARYKIFENNENEQANAGEVKEFVNRGWVTSIGDGTEKHFEHYLYSDTSKQLKSVEKYTIDFISKMNFGTIQNNNLMEERTLGVKREVKINIPHIKANQYSNAWVFNKGLLEQKFPEYLIRGKDGRFDMEVIIEFLPQRIFYYSVIVSLVSLLLTIILAVRLKLTSKGT